MTRQTEVWIFQIKNIPTICLVILLLFFPGSSDAFSVPNIQQQQPLDNGVKATSVELTDPETGCQVILLGCFHGTVSSAKDVERLLLDQASPTDAVALELCATRFADLQRELLQQQEQSLSTSSRTPPITTSKPWLFRYFSMVAKTLETRGLATAVATAVLGGVSGLQTAISGFTPGLEFTTALKLANMEDGKECDIVLADQNVDETLRRIGNLPQVAFDIWTHPATLGDDSAALLGAIMGFSEYEPYQVSIGKVMVRNTEAVQDLFRLTLPPFLLATGMAAVLSHALYDADAAALYNTMADNSFVVSSPSTVDSSTGAVLWNAVPHVLVRAMALGLGYVGVALPAARVILAERDDILTTGIQAACRLAAAKHEKDGKRGRVVAVLGLLHVNGVARRMLSTVKDDSSKTQK
jgi:hypothetical protein